MALEKVQLFGLACMVSKKSLQEPHGRFIAKKGCDKISKVFIDML